MVSASVSPRPPSPPVQATVIQVGASGSCKKSTVGGNAPDSNPRCDDIEQLRGTSCEKFDNQIARSSSEQHARSSTGTPTGTRISAHQEHMSRKSADASRSYCLAHTLSSASDASILRKKVDATVVRSSVKAIDHFGEKDPLPKSVVKGVSHKKEDRENGGHAPNHRFRHLFHHSRHLFHHSRRVSSHLFHP